MNNQSGRIIVGRPINGISLNGLEYLLDENSDFITFKSEDEAKQMLKENGVTEEQMDGIVFEEIGGVCNVVQ